MIGENALFTALKCSMNETPLHAVSELNSRSAAGNCPAAGCRVQVEEPAQLPLVRIGVE